MVESTLQHLIYGNAIIANKATEAADVLAISEEVSPEDAKRLVQEIPLSPLPIDDVQQSQAVAFVSVNGTDEKQYVMARTHFQNDEQSLPIHQLVLIPNDHSGKLLDFDTLLTLIDQPIPTYSVTNAPLEPLTLTSDGTMSSDKKVMIIKSLLDDVIHGDFRLLLGILSFATQDKVVICNFPQDNAQRLALLRGLRLLIPAATRPLLTFTTNTDLLNGSLPRITFSETSEETDAYRLDWQNPMIEDLAYEHPYIVQLLSVWDNDVIHLVDVVKRYDEIAAVLTRDDLSLDENLSAIAQRHRMDLTALKGDMMPTADMLAVFSRPVPMSLELQTAYLILLLENNFESRDPETAQNIAALLTASSDLDASAEPFFKTSIEEQPDAVYAFVRTYLHNSDDDNVSERWLKRLHDAADASVKIAIESGDAATIRSWLTLLSREPLRYELSDILHDAMLAAQPFVADSTDLAQELLTVAVKRQPDMLDDLLADDQLLAALPEYIHKALIHHGGAAIEALSNESRDLFLLSLNRGISGGHAAVTSASVRALWTIHTHQQTNTLPPQFRPASILQTLAEHPDSFINGAYGTLLTLILADGSQDELFYQLVPFLAEKDKFSDALAQALEQSNRDIEALMAILTYLLANEWLTAQAAVNTISNLLVNRNWDESNLPLVEQLARVMTQHPDTDAPMGVLWKLSELSAVHKNEQMSKVAMRRLLDSTNELVSESQVVESIQNIRKDSSWSATGRSVLIKWWRNYAREQGTGKLQKIDKLLDGKRSLEDLRAIVQTTIALRRIIGNRTLEEFSEAVAITYNLLQALSEGFDPSDKLVDSTTIRNEIDARADELPTALRPVLSTNLKELAQIVTTLADNRSKPSLIRSDDTVERQLVKGEQEPQAAIDVMRWLSGYLDGVQKDDEHP